MCYKSNREKGFLINQNTVQDLFFLRKSATLPFFFENSDFLLKIETCINLKKLPSVIAFFFIRDEITAINFLNLIIKFTEKNTYIPVFCSQNKSETRLLSNYLIMTLALKLSLQKSFQKHSKRIEMFFSA